MAENIRQVVWTKRSQLQMKNIYEYISKDSPQNALKILNDIADEVSKTINNAEFFGPDKYKLNNDGSYRAFENTIIGFHIGLQKTSSGFCKFAIPKWSLKYINSDHYFFKAKFLITLS